MPILSLGETSERQARARSLWPVTARTSRFTIALNDRWIGPVILDGGGIVRGVDDRAARQGRRTLREGRREAAEKKQS